jgi:hypothetical protein
MPNPFSKKAICCPAYLLDCLIGLKSQKKNRLCPGFAPATSGQGI